MPCWPGRPPKPPHGPVSASNPQPWSKLSYDTDPGGYLVNVTADQLQDAPRFSESDRDRAHDRDYQSSVYNYWQVQPYW